MCIRDRFDSFGNPNLQWEVAKMQNYGVEFSYGSRLKGSFEYFITKRDKFLQQVSGSDIPGGYSYYAVSYTHQDVYKRQNV